MKKTLFQIPKMDCPSEEKLIRMALGPYNEKIVNLSFDLGNRQMTSIHNGDSSDIIRLVAPLNFGIKLIDEIDVSDAENSAIPSEKDETKTLVILLSINFIMFLLEIIMGFIADSTGLIADSMDMLADAIIYGISLAAVGKSIQLQNKAAKISGYFQVLLALSVLFEVGRRYFMGSDPESSLMVVISLIALLGNVTCLFLIHKHRDSGAHMKASWIFSSNDVIANAGVILAGFLVKATGSPIPDLVIGLVISIVVMRGAIGILRIKSN